MGMVGNYCLSVKIQKLLRLVLNSCRISHSIINDTERIFALKIVITVEHWVYIASKNCGKK